MLVGLSATAKMLARIVSGPRHDHDQGKLIAADNPDAKQLADTLSDRITNNPVIIGKHDGPVDARLPPPRVRNRTARVKTQFRKDPARSGSA